MTKITALVTKCLTFFNSNIPFPFKRCFLRKSMYKITIKKIARDTKNQIT